MCKESEKTHKENKMKTCKHCGAQNFDINTTCDKCGNPLGNTVELVSQAPYQPKPTVYNTTPTTKNSGMTTAAKILMIISTASYGVAFLTFFILWFITLILQQESGFSELKMAAVTYFLYTALFLAAALAGFFMTVDYSRKIEDGKKVSIAFKVCSLIFINMIAGILMLIDNPEKVQPTVETETAVSEFDQQMLELKKLKKLLDMGILTQEEFDEKKKQILGL